jgi:hypothetical protein
MNNKMQMNERINKPETGMLERLWTADHRGPGFPQKPELDLQTVVATENRTSTRPRLTVGAAALSALRWSAERSGDEFCFWGVLEQADSGLYLREAVLAKHQGSPGYSNPDMDWYGDLVMEMNEREGLEPWQLACWIHTHPPGLCRPSGVDEETFAQQFGRQRLAIMLIMTRDLIFHGELSVNLPVLPGLPPVRLTGLLQITFEDPQASVNEAEKQSLEREYNERVSSLGNRFGRGPRRRSGWPDAADEEESPARLLDEEDYEGVLLEMNEPPESRNHSWLATWPDLPVYDGELLAYIETFPIGEGMDASGFDPQMLDLEIIASRLGDPEMSVGEAAALRERIRRLAELRRRMEDRP